LWTFNANLLTGIIPFYPQTFALSGIKSFTSNIILSFFKPIGLFFVIIFIPLAIMGEVKLKKSARTRRYIIEKAGPIFNKKGYSGTSLHDIIEATGLTKGGIYGNFANKDEIAAAVFEYNSRQILDQIKSRVLSEHTARDKLYAITGFYRQYLYNPALSGGCPILNTAVEADDMHPTLRELVLRSLDYIRRSFIYLINQGIEAGEFRENVDSEYFATVFWSLIEGGIMQMKIYNKARYLTDCLLQMETIIDGLAPDIK
jgi:AcrR family transcriptional regulator